VGALLESFGADVVADGERVTALVVDLMAFSSVW
jgi:hypothetical protein